MGTLGSEALFVIQISDLLGQISDVTAQFVVPTQLE